MCASAKPNAERTNNTNSSSRFFFENARPFAHEILRIQNAEIMYCWFRQLREILIFFYFSLGDFKECERYISKVKLQKSLHVMKLTKWLTQFFDPKPLMDFFAKRPTIVQFLLALIYHKKASTSHKTERHKLSLNGAAPVGPQNKNGFFFATHLFLRPFPRRRKTHQKLFG